VIWVGFHIPHSQYLRPLVSEGDQHQDLVRLPHKLLWKKWLLMFTLVFHKNTRCIATTADPLFSVSSLTIMNCQRKQPGRLLVLAQLWMLNQMPCFILGISYPEFCPKYFIHRQKNHLAYVASILKITSSISFSRYMHLCIFFFWVHFLNEEL